MTVGGKCGEVSKPVKKRPLYKSCYAISLSKRWAEMCSFSLTSNGSGSWANILSHFRWANLTLAAPRRRTWQWQMRQCVEEWSSRGRRGGGGSGGSPREGWLPPRGETLTHWPRLAASQHKPSLAHGAASVCTHFYTWTNSETGQEKQPTHPCLSHCPPPPPHARTRHHRLPSDLQSFFSFICCPHMAVYLYFMCLKTLFAVLWMHNLTIIYLVLFLQLLILTTNVCIKKKKITLRRKVYILIRKREDTLHSVTFEHVVDPPDVSSVQWHLMTDDTRSCVVVGLKYITLMPDQRLAALITTKGDDKRQNGSFDSQLIRFLFIRTM